jgi:hypothetical protein
MNEYTANIEHNISIEDTNCGWGLKMIRERRKYIVYLVDSMEREGMILW